MYQIRRRCRKSSKFSHKKTQFKNQQSRHATANNHEKVSTRRPWGDASQSQEDTRICPLPRLRITGSKRHRQKGCFGAGEGGVGRGVAAGAGCEGTGGSALLGAFGTGGGPGKALGARRGGARLPYPARADQGPVMQPDVQQQEQRATDVRLCVCVCVCPGGGGCVCGCGAGRVRESVE